MQQFDAARDSFARGDYQAALTQVENALREMPTDAVLHEFRALVLFALGDYTQAAAAVHSVLAAGPGWDWTTMSSLYPDKNVYTQQLRALEAFRDANPQSAAAHFLLAYHYLTTGYEEAAAKELTAVTELEPDDSLAAGLLKMVSGESTAEPPPSASEQPAAPAGDAAAVSAESLVGTWQAARPDGTVTLELTGDARFTWSFSHGEQAQSFGGTYTLADSLLVLERDDGGAMVGRVTPAGEAGFNFRLVEGPPSDPGIDFERQQ